MTYNDLYLAALKKIGITSTATQTEDYEDRAPYLLASFCSTCSSLDRKYRKANGLKAATFSNVAAVNMNDSFALSDVLIPAASCYLGAMLVLEENEAMSDRLFDQYCDELASIEAALPAACEAIVSKYSNLL